MDVNHLLNHDTVPLIISLLLASAVTVIIVISIQWRRVRIAETDAVLKSRMIERGYSVGDIERVCSATTEDKPQKRNRWHRKTEPSSMC